MKLYYEEEVALNEQVGRVTQLANNYFKLMTEEGEISAIMTGNRQDHGFYPAIGDYVVYTSTEDKSLNLIKRLLSRRSSLVRKVAGQKSDEQVIAANMDYVFIVMALNNDFNVRRLERYMVAAWSSQATPVVILTKMDLCDDLEERLLSIESQTLGVDVIPVGVLDQMNLEALTPYLKEENTIALVGSSGVGKSTLINYLAGQEVMKTDGLRDDDRGHHTTTYRKLIATPRGMFIDTPGMRELSLYDQEEGLNHEFSDIEQLSETCRFSDCKHEREPGCAIRMAIEEGLLDEERYHSYLNLKREIRFQKRKIAMKERQLEKRNQYNQSKPRQKRWKNAY
jgi:ribosome biogenesis GTPase